MTGTSEPEDTITARILVELRLGYGEAVRRGVDRQALTDELIARRRALVAMQPRPAMPSDAGAPVDPDGTGEGLPE